MMMSQVDIPLDKGTTPRLPVLKDGQNSLVSAEPRPAPPTPRERASDWALEVRKRINAAIEEKSQVPEDDVRLLKQELVPVFVVCLQQDNRISWSYLTEILGLLEPYSDYLDHYDIKAEMFHYLERIHQHIQTHKERLFDLHITEALAKVFPKEMAQLKESDSRPLKNYCVTIPAIQLSSEPPSPKIRKLVPAPPNLRSLPDGTNPYSMYINTEEQMQRVKPLTFGDLRKSIANVAVDMATRESIWSRPYGPVAQALHTEIPESESEKTSPEREQPGFKLTPRSGVANFTAAERKFKKSPRIEEEAVPVMTGRDAVRYFVECHHTGEIRSLFFNYAPSRHYRPYDLVCVHKNKVNPEHFVFSTFGVLHVVPKAPNESMELGEWQREAVLWTAVSNIPFFKLYLVKKMFDRWRANKLYLDYLRRSQEISSALLPAVPAFGAALLQVMRLLKELITVNFLPFEVDKTYQLSDFENNVNYKNIQAEKLLEKFFRYCKMVVDVTAEESFTKLRYCEEQVKKKSYFTKDSLHMQKVKKEQREQNLRLAKSETGRLGNFVNLVDQMIVEHMFYLTKTQVMTFINSALIVGSEAPRDGFFKANLVFTKQDVLGISPSKEKFTKVLNNTLKGIPAILCANAVAMDGSLLEGAETQTVADETESTGPKSEAAKSSTEQKHPFLERRKSTAALTQSSTGKAGTTSRTQMSEAVMSQMGDTMTVISAAQTEVPLSKTKSVVGDDGEMAVPDLPRQTTFTKEEDDLGVATPDLVVQGEGQELAVEGEGFMGQYQPLSRASLEEKLEKDAEFQQTLGAMSDVLKAALEEIDEYCDYNKWLNEINMYCKKWTDKSVRELKGEAAFTIEQKLTELRQWSEKVRHFDHNFITENGLFYIDCSLIHENLLPKLNDIYLEIVTFVAEEAKSLANNFCVEMKNILQNLKEKLSSVDSFAAYAKNFNLYKKNTSSYQQKVEYIKSLYEVIRMSYRQLTSEEEKYEENVWAAWEAFLLQMQDASEFVNTQTPLMTQLLEDTYQKLEKEAYDLMEIATTGKFLDPAHNPTHILIDMKRLRDKFYSIQRQLQQASKWRDAICGEPYDLTFLNEMTVTMDVRQELWKYVEVSTHAIKDWKQMLFKKMNIKKALEKVIEWQAAAAQLKPYLPVQDRVLTTWFKTLQDFKKDLPVLHKLANDALKERHWKAIFVGMNESYDPKREFTVADLLTYDLDEHAQLIHSIYLGAVAEYDLELKIGHLKKFWEEREFKLAKHIPDSLLQSKEPKKDVSPRRRTKLEKYRQEKAAAANVGTFQGLNVADDDYYVLIEVEDLKYQLEDSRISIRGMMQSPFLGDMSAEVEMWSSSLQQVEEITDLWYTCQKKWMYLLKVFEWPELYKRFQSQAAKFESIHTRFKDWMRVVSNDSKVLTVINRRRGEKGYRLLQGDNLRALFLQLIQLQEEILKHMSSLMENCRMEFTRLYFLSDEELVEMMGVSRNPQALLPFAKKCFPGIKSLAFALPPGTASLNTHLDFALHADKLQVIAMRGLYGEEVPFFAHLEAQSKSTRWLKLLEGIMKNTMATILQACVQARMDDGSKQPIHLLEELTKSYSSKTNVSEDESALEIKHSFRHWLLRFPVQCVYVAEGVLWARQMNRLLDRPEVDTEDLKHFSYLKPQTLMVPQTPPIYNIQPQYTTYQIPYAFNQTSPQWATPSSGQWRWAQSPTTAMATASPSYMLAMASPELMYAQVPPHTYQPAELTDAAMLESAGVEGSIFPVEPPNTQQVSQYASDVVSVQQSTEQTRQPKTSPAVAAVFPYPSYNYIPAIAPAFHTTNVNPATAVPVTTTIASSTTASANTPAVSTNKLASVVVPSQVMAPYTKPYVTVPRRTFAPQTFLVRNGHKVQCVMMPPKSSSLFQHTSDEDSNSVRSAGSPSVTQG